MIQAAHKVGFTYKTMLIGPRGISFKLDKYHYGEWVARGHFDQLADTGTPAFQVNHREGKVQTALPELNLVGQEV